MTITAIELPRESIAEFCCRWHVTEFALFGSVLRDDFRSDSDIDVMVQFHPDAHPTFRTLDQMETELRTIFQREVDLITRQGIETSRNYLRRQEILSSAQVIYAAGSSISLDMLQSAELLLSYTAQCSRNEFVANVQLQDAVIRRLLIIGEAARRVSGATRQTLPNIAWQEINGMRNRLVHEYDDVNLNIVWDVVQLEIPPLIEALKLQIPPAP